MEVEEVSGELLLETIRVHHVELHPKLQSQSVRTLRDGEGGREGEREGGREGSGGEEEESRYR